MGWAEVSANEVRYRQGWGETVKKRCIKHVSLLVLLRFHGGDFPWLGGGGFASLALLYYPRVVHIARPKAVY